MRILTKLTAITLILLSLSAAHGSTADDTLNISGKSVVFFGPTQSEYDALNEDIQSEMNEVLTDFYYYNEKVLPFLNRNKIREFFTDKAIITIQLTGTEIRSFRRQDFKQAVGMIMSDGRQEPKVYLGVATDIDLLKMFEDFFSLE